MNRASTRRAGIGIGIALVTAVTVASSGCAFGTAVAVKETQSQPLRFGAIGTMLALEAGLFLALESTRDDGFGWYYTGAIAVDVGLAALFGRCFYCYRDTDATVDQPVKDRFAEEAPPMAPEQVECLKAGKVMTSQLMSAVADRDELSELRSDSEGLLAFSSSNHHWSAEARRCMSVSFEDWSNQCIPMLNQEQVDDVTATLKNISARFEKLTGER